MLSYFIIISWRTFYGLQCTHILVFNTIFSNALIQLDLIPDSAQMTVSQLRRIKESYRIDPGNAVALAVAAAERCIYFLFVV